MKEGIEKIIDVLRNTKIPFIQLELLDDQCGRCLEGVLAYRLIPKNELLHEKSLTTVTRYNEKQRKKLFNFYGVDILNTSYDKSIICECGVYLTTLEMLFYHINDSHSHSHKDNADMLERLHKR